MWTSSRSRLETHLRLCCWDDTRLFTELRRGGRPLMIAAPTRRVRNPWPALEMSAAAPRRPPTDTSGSSLLGRSRPPRRSDISGVNFVWIISLIIFRASRGRSCSARVVSCRNNHDRRRWTDLITRSVAPRDLEQRTHLRGRGHHAWVFVMSGEIVVSVLVQIAPGREEEFLEVMRHDAVESRKEPGCVLSRQQVPGRAHVHVLRGVPRPHRRDQP